MPELSFYWHDYETFGREPRRDRPSQFAGVRTDAELNEIGAPLMQYCRPTPDYLPEPEACLLTGILPQTCLERGVPEREFADVIEQQLARPGTVGVGYNSIRFDDEVTRFLFWRNLMDPYAREWQNECGRWDLLDVVRCAYALRPEDIEWPLHDNGKVSFRLEHLAIANGIAHGDAHDALADVRATIALARLVKSRKPRLWDFCLRLRSKREVMLEIGLHRPFLHVAGLYGAERGCIALVWPLASNPGNKNEIIVWDLSVDPLELFALGADDIRARTFGRGESLPPGVVRLPIKTIQINKSPVVIGNVKTLGDERAARWGLDLAQALRHAELIAQKAGLFSDVWARVFERPAQEGRLDVDEDLYSAFVGAEDRRALQGLRVLGGAELASKRPVFKDARLDELVFRYRARNFPESLDPRERALWRAHCSRRLRDGVAGPTFDAYVEHLDALLQGADERGRHVLEELLDYAARIVPEHG